MKNDELGYTLLAKEAYTGITNDYFNEIFFEVLPDF